MKGYESLKWQIWKCELSWFLLGQLHISGTMHTLQHYSPQLTQQLPTAHKDPFVYSTHLMPLSNPFDCHRVCINTTVNTITCTI